MGDAGGPNRTTAIVLFTDLVASTELRARLGEQVAEELRRRHDQILTAAVTGHHGVVVKGLGDGIMARFAGAGDALAAGVAIQQGMERHNRSSTASAPMHVRVGLSAGDVSIEDADCFGTPVIEAARLCAAAEAGQILSAMVVHWLARGSAHEFRPLGALELKGLPEPLPAGEIAWSPGTTATVPLPPLLTDVGRVFVGRDSALDRLHSLWEDVAAGERRVALVAGEPGVGKTRLSAEFARFVHEAGCTVLAGRCDEDLGVPFQPFVEALRHQIEHAAPAELPRLLGRHGGELERLSPGLRERLPDTPPSLVSDPETERYRLFEAVTAWLAASAGEEPLLVILDDLQWAGKPTLLLLRHIARAADRMRLLIVGTYRDTELQPDHPLVELLADLRRQHGVERLSLAGFDRSQVADYLASSAGHGMDADGLALASAIHAETEGNPFFVREILRHLTEQGSIVRRDGRWVTSPSGDELGLPESVREVVARRVSRLPRDAAALLRLAAVVGPSFEVSVVAQASRIEGEALLSAVEVAIAARLVLEVAGEPDRFRFTHALVRETLYDQLSGARRAAMHRSVAEAIEKVHAHALEDYLPALAHHWGQTGEANAARAADYAARAGERAVAQLAHDEAASFYRLALRLGEASGATSQRQCEHQIALGEAQRRAGDAGYRATLLDAARHALELQDPDLLARAVLANRRGLFGRSGGVDAERVALLELALDGVGPADTPERARLLAALASELHFSTDERRVEFGRQGLAIARRLEDVATLAETLVAVWLATWDPDAAPERALLADELNRISDRIVDPVLRFHTGWARFLSASERGDMAVADEGLATCSQIADEVGQPLLRWRTAGLHAHRAFADGRLEDAEQWAEEALRWGLAAEQPDAAALNDVFIVRLLQGRPDEAVNLTRSLAEVWGYQGMAVYPAVLAWACAEAGLADEARENVARVRGGSFTGLRRDYLWLAVLAVLGRTCAQLEDRPAAAELYDLLRPYSGAYAIGQSAWFGPVAYDLGLLATALGRFAEADAHFAEAVDAHRRAGVRGMLAHTYLAWAQMLLARRQPGDLERAATLLNDARSTAQVLGFVGVEQQAADLLETSPDSGAE